MAPTEIPFKQLLDALLDADTPLNPRFLYRLSDLEQNELEALQAVWPQTPAWRRQALMEDIEELSYHDTLLSFVPLGCFAVQDEDPKVRLAAVRTLWEYEDNHLIPLFLGLLEKDEDTEVRAACAAALGRYIFIGEIEELSAGKLRQIEEALLQASSQEQPAKVRRLALESLGYSSRAEAPALIEAAYHSQDKDWIASALFAMGRSAHEMWFEKVLAMLGHPIPAVRCEAARAAGELEISRALPQLLELLDDPDDNTRTASIWSLSQIGGSEAQKALEGLYELTEDEDELQLIEEAIDNLLFNQSLILPLLDLADSEMAGDDYEDIVDDYLNDYLYDYLNDDLYDDLDDDDLYEEDQDFED